MTTERRKNLELEKAQNQQKFIRLRKNLLSYIQKKESLTRAQIISVEQVGKKRGFLTSLWPIIKLTNFFENYAEKKGIFYKLFHLTSTKYIPGKPVLFIDARNFYGGLIKRLLTGKSLKDQLAIRLQNIGYAEALVREIDKNLYNSDHTEMNPILFCVELLDQLTIKKQRGENDAYSKLLKKSLYKINEEIFAHAREIIDEFPENYLQGKAYFLDYLAHNTVFDDFSRGKDYSYKSFLLFKQENYDLEYQDCVEKFIQAQNQKQQQHVGPLKHPIIECFDISNRTMLPLPRSLKFADERMHMNLDYNKYALFQIAGTTEEGQLVGKDMEILDDGWYQFVIMPETTLNGAPLIRYYPCGDKKSGIPFAKQVVPNREPRLEGSPEEYHIQSPEGHQLKYNKYITHSQLAGGRPIIAGGAFMIKNGALCVIDDSSGHYNLKEDSQERFNPLITAKEAFSYFGTDTTGTILEHWKPYHGLDKLLKKGAAVLTQPLFETDLSARAEISDSLAEGRSTVPKRVDNKRVFKSPIQHLFRDTLFSSSNFVSFSSPKDEAKTPEEWALAMANKLIRKVGKNKVALFECFPPQYLDYYKALQEQIANQIPDEQNRPCIVVKIKGDDVTNQNVLDLGLAGGTGPLSDANLVCNLVERLANIPAGTLSHNRELVKESTKNISAVLYSMPPPRDFYHTVQGAWRFSQLYSEARKAAPCKTLHLLTNTGHLIKWVFENYLFFGSRMYGPVDDLTTKVAAKIASEAPDQKVLILGTKIASDKKLYGDLFDKEKVRSCLPEQSPTTKSASVYLQEIIDHVKAGKLLVPFTNNKLCAEAFIDFVVENAHITESKTLLFACTELSLILHATATDGETYLTKLKQQLGEGYRFFESEELFIDSIIESKMSSKEKLDTWPSQSM